MMLSEITHGTQADKDSLKQNADKLNDKLVKYAISVNSTNLITGDAIYSTYLSKGDGLSRQNAIKYNYPLFNSTDCEEYLVQYYILSSVDDLVFVSNKIGPALNEEDNTSYKFSAYNGITGDKLDISLCNDKTYTVQLPLANKTALNLTLYNELKRQSIDIFNAYDPAFTDRCFAHLDNNTGYDTTLNWRKQNYLQQKQPMCIGFNCTYQGISEFDYVECSCTGLTSGNEVVNQLVGIFTQTVSNFNIGVVLCYNLIPNVN
jgi:hypothetical protein